MKGGIKLVKVFIDPGHGGSDVGASANGLMEKDLVLNIALSLRDQLEDNYQGVSTNLSRTTDTDVSLEERASLANEWGADYFVSIHVNAGGGEGFESYIWSGTFENKEETERLRSIVHDEIVERMDWRDRGKKEANYHVLRETEMPAVLTENGFIDNEQEAEQMRSESWIVDVAEAHAAGIAEALELEETSTQETDDTFYRVVAGSFEERSNAENRQEELNEQGIESFIAQHDEFDNTYYRVIAGSFQERSNAEERARELESLGFESFIVTHSN